MMDPEIVLDLIRSHPGLTAAQIGSRLNVPREILLHILYEELQGQVAADRSYGWWPSDQLPAQQPRAEAAVRDANLNTLPQRLLQYYLECVKRDREHEVSFPIQNEDADFIALPELPLSPNTWEQLPENPVRAELEHSEEVANGRKLLHVGYPIRIQPDGAGQGLRVEPFFVFLVESNGAAGWAVAEDAFSINSAILRSDEAVPLLDQLGLGGVDALPPWDELFLRLHRLNQAWPWREPPLPLALEQQPAIATLQEDGYYNRAILFAASPPRFTSGLESELRWLLGGHRVSFGGTALGSWMMGPLESEEKDPAPLLEVMPLNQEQRGAVQSGLTAPLTVITGPPGTGKSQVVASLIVNAVYRGQRVLFACRNNKPVDVVATRVNDMGPVPLLQLVGRREDTPRLRQFVDNLLVAAQDPEQEEQERFFLRRQERLRMEMAALSSALEESLAARNAWVEATQRQEAGLSAFSRERWETLRTLSIQEWETALESGQHAVSKATRLGQPLFVRLFWRSRVQERLNDLVEILQTVNRMAESMGAQPIAHAATESLLPNIAMDLRRLDEITPKIHRAQEDLAALSEIAGTRRIEEITAAEAGLLDQLMEISRRLWDCWLQLRPQRLSEEDRQHLMEFSALLALLEGEAGGVHWRDYYKAYEKVASILPCAWALTALRARSLPCQPALFDLLIMDEAAAGDIASALPLLYRCRRAVIIGDKNQMSHITQMSPSVDRALRDRFDLSATGYSKWSYVANSLFALAVCTVPRRHIVNLRDHHRSHRDIIEFSNQTFYDGALRVVTRYDQLRAWVPNQPAVTWDDVRGHTVRPASGSAYNTEEAERVAEIIDGLEADGSIGVVTPFALQREVLKERLHAHNNLLIDTANRFQGDERDIIVFSPVLSEGAPDSTIRFLRHQFNLFNVAVTRARSRLLIVGDREAARHSGVQYLEALVAYVEGLAVPREQGEPGRDYGPVYPAALRDESGMPERHLYEALYARGVRASPRITVEQYILQLALFGEGPDGPGLNVEVDDRPEELWTHEFARRLMLRDHRLMELGWKVLRFYAHEVEHDIESCVRRVEEGWGRF